MSGSGGRMQHWLNAEKNKMKDMTVRQKISYILTYYWLWIVGILTALFLMVFFINRMFFSIKDFWFYGMFANTMENGGNESDLWYDFVDYADFDTTQKKVEMNSRTFFDPTVSGGTNNSYYQAFVALVESGDLDVVVMGTEALRGTGSSGRLLDLNDEKCAGVMGKYSDRIITCIPYDEEYSEEPVPVGIDVSDSLLCTKYHLYEGDCALGISAYTDRIESVETFLDFLFSEEEVSTDNG